MAEAFGIAGSTFGTVSLGLQLFREISQYIDDVEGRDEDLERGRSYAQTFQSCLTALDAQASNSGISNTEVERLINEGQANYLEYGQLSRLVLIEDHNMVHDFLEKHPLSINEINHLGQTPVHIAVQTQNATVLSIIVNQAGPTVLNTKDNNGLYPIDHATDAVCHARKSGKVSGSKVCNGCEVLDVLLHSESAIFTRSVQRAMRLPWSHDIPSCIEGQKNIIRCLASRRKDLGILAQRELTPLQRQDLKICQASNLDQNAAKTQWYLETNNCHVPIYLKVYDDAESPEDSKSIYTLIFYGEVAECALQNGFLMPTTVFDDVFHIIAESSNSGWFGSRRQGFLFSSYICWLVDHGGDLRSIIPIVTSHTTAAHYFMAYLGQTQHSFRRRHSVTLSSTVSSIIFGEDDIDDCRCQCSPTGCTPLTKFLAVINWKQTWVLDLGIDRAIGCVLEHLEYLYGLLGHVGYDLRKEHWIDSAVVRHFTFLILDLRHTCCRLGHGHGMEPSGPLSNEDRQEIEEEDCSRLELFEQLVMEFERERGNYTDLFSFGEEYWAPKMKIVDQEIGSCVLTESQKQAAKAVGAVFESYGPQLPPNGEGLEVVSEKEEVVSDLEKALRELDEIATDPLRPGIV
ncbi:Ff.00g006660.m01.CDS01 [Fusarium sp. VM40]|nr:Ff.00g006660.m01.CDS01 [Fusarium sp. VM40]